jgi:SAM-dependent methyltransferase
MKQPPKLLVEALDAGTLVPCKGVDLGCGTGNYTAYLAERGFDMTGVDISATALDIAKQTAGQKGVEVELIAWDLTQKELPKIGPFDFALEWDVLHHIFPDQRRQYVKNVAALLRPGAKVLSACFSELDRSFKGQGKYRETPIGTVLYFSSEAEIRALFEPFYKILDLKTVEVEGKMSPPKAVFAWMERR